MSRSKLFRAYLHHLVVHGYHFFDGDEDLESHSEGPSLLHYRSALLEEVGKQQTYTKVVHLYDEDGNPLQNQQPSNDQSTVHLNSMMSPSIETQPVTKPLLTTQLMTTPLLATQLITIPLLAT